MRLRLIDVVLLLVLGACQGGEAPAADTSSAGPTRAPSVIAFTTLLTCGDREASAEYAGDSAIVVANGTRMLLRRTPSGSARYVDALDSTTFLTRGPAGTSITMASVAEPACRDVPVGPFVARGIEPGWMLTIAGDSLTYIGNYGTDTARTAIAGTSTRDRATSYTTTNMPRLLVMVRAGVCGDAATGMPHPFTVTVRHDTSTVSGCGGEPASLLTGETWTVRQVAERAMTESPPTMLFSRAGRVAGSTSCNQYSAPYSLTGEGLAFGPAIATKRACQAPLMDQEGWFLQALGKVARFEISADGELRLQSDGGGAIVATRIR